MLIGMAFFLVAATAHRHAKKEHAQQVAAAREAEHLRAAYRAAADMPMDVLYQRGRRLSQPLRQTRAAGLREAMPVTGP